MYKIDKCDVRCSFSSLKIDITALLIRMHRYLAMFETYIIQKKMKSEITEKGIRYV